MDWQAQNGVRAAFYEGRYEVIAAYPFAGRKVYLPERISRENRSCIFCGRTTPETSFSSIAHAVPEFLGNRALLAANECDTCNSFFAREYEDHLARWSNASRTLFKVRGKKGIPNYNSSALSIEHVAGEKNITVRDPRLSEELIHTARDSNDKNGELRFPSSQFVPIRAAMALVKIGCSVCPIEEMHQLGPSIDWLMERIFPTFSCFPVWLAKIPLQTAEHCQGQIQILRRIVDDPIPYLWCLLSARGLGLQWFMPLCPNDGWLLMKDKTITIPSEHFPRRFDLNWSGNESTTKITTVTLRDLDLSGSGSRTGED